MLGIEGGAVGCIPDTPFAYLCQGGGDGDEVGDWTGSVSSVLRGERDQGGSQDLEGFSHWKLVGG